MAIDKHSFSEFLEHIFLAREVPIIIAEDQDELHEYSHLLDQAGYHEQESVYHLIQVSQSPTKDYLVLDDHHPYTIKQAYDFVVQYPTGQIEVSDQVTLQKAVFSPNYQESTCLLLITHRELQKVESTGLEFLSHTGMAYQSPAVSEENHEVNQNA